MRHFSAILAAAALVVTLGACSSTPAGSSADLGTPCTSTVASGASSKLVRVSGGTTTEPDVTFGTPLISKKLERSVLIEGDGRFLADGDVADLNVVQFDGAEKTKIASTWEDKSTIRAIVGEDAGVIQSALTCARVGSRIVATVPISLLVEGAAEDDPRTSVVVIDVVDGFPGRADGAPQLPKNGLPAVVLAPTGQPGIVIPKIDAPKKIEKSLLQAGDGAKVAEGDSVVAHYTGMLWNDSTIFDSSWEKGGPFSFIAQGDGDALSQAVIGQRVGSQVLIVIPDGKGTASGEAAASVPSGSTMVYVVDILHIAD